MKNVEIPLTESIFFQTSRDWIQVKNFDLKKFLPRNKCDRYVGSSKDAEKLIRILFTEVIDHFPAGKVSTIEASKNGIHILYLYFNNASLLKFLRYKYPELSFEWKTIDQNNLKGALEKGENYE